MNTELEQKLADAALNTICEYGDRLNRSTLLERLRAKGFRFRGNAIDFEELMERIGLAKDVEYKGGSRHVYFTV